MLLLGDGRHRLSIDIDIICPPGTDIEEYLKDYKDFGFEDFKVIERQQRGIKIPKSHSKFYYQVSYKDGLDMRESILLDVLNEDCHYNNVLTIPISNPFVMFVGSPNMVKIPSVEDVLGDKLTAFAPNTTGIPYYKNGNDMGMEIIKQVYDIARLFEKLDDLPTSGRTFKKIAEIELQYRNLDNNLNIIYEDIRNTALCLATHGHEGKGEFELLQRGLTRIKNFMFDNKYILSECVRDAAIAAYVATLIEKGKRSFERYNGNPRSIENFKINPKLTNRLNRLKRFEPEAYFYWCKIGDLL